MKQLFVIKPQVDKTGRKPFAAICTSEAATKLKLSALQETGAEWRIEPFMVQDFDPNRSQAYVVLKRVEGKGQIEDICFDYMKTESKVKELRKGLSPHAQKEVYVEPCMLNA
jgi:hypothetical protein